MNLINSGFLRGIGVGLIVSGLLVNLSGSTSEHAKVITQQQQVTSGEKVQQTTTPTTPTQPVQPMVANADQTKPKPQTQTQTKPQTEQKPERPDIITLRIPGGSGSEEIAAILYDQKLITSEKEFAALSEKMKADTRFKAGKFSIPSGASYKEIIGILTGK